jgi:hypothetical protein
MSLKLSRRHSGPNHNVFRPLRGIIDEEAHLELDSAMEWLCEIGGMKMSAGNVPSNQPVSEQPEPYPPLPQFSASGRPNTRAERIAFQVWIIMFLLVIMFTLINYLAMRL